MLTNKHWGWSAWTALQVSFLINIGSSIWISESVSSVSSGNSSNDYKEIYCWHN